MLLYRIDGNFAQGIVKHWVMNYQVGRVLLKKFEAFTEAVDFAVQVLLTSTSALRRRDEPRERYDFVWGMNHAFDVEDNVALCFD